MTRQCGGCTLCCKLMPVPDLDKPAGVRCTHQRTGKGCAIYPRRPVSCRLWSCMWLVGPDTDELRRPDRARYVIDSTPDFILLRSNETGEVTHRIPVIQIWLDPAAPDAWKDEALTAWLERRGEQGLAALVRRRQAGGNVDGFVIFPPALTPDGEWHIRDSNLSSSGEHSAAEKAAVLAEAGIGWNFELAI